MPSIIALTTSNTATENKHNHSKVKFWKRPLPDCYGICHLLRHFLACRGWRMPDRCIFINTASSSCNRSL